MTKGSFMAFHFLLFLGLCVTSRATVPDLLDDENHGAAAVPNRYPYFALVKYFSDQGPSGTCGGSLIAPDVVLTAATCASERHYGPPRSVDVWVNSTSSEYSEYDYFRKVVRWAIHPRYNDYSHGNDIALLFLDTPVMGVPLVQLNRENSLPDDSSLMTVVGNGTPRRDGCPRPDLGFCDNSQETANAPSLSQKQVITSPLLACWKAYGSNNFKDSLLCAGNHGLGGGVSGAPLLIAGSEVKEDVQVGITTGGSRRDMDMGYWSSGETGSNSPKGYTRVSHFVEWIDAQMCQYSTRKPSNCPTEILKSVD